MGRQSWSNKSRNAARAPYLQLCSTGPGHHPLEPPRDADPEGAQGGHPATAGRSSAASRKPAKAPNAGPNPAMDTSRKVKLSLTQILGLKGSRRPYGRRRRSQSSPEQARTPLAKSTTGSLPFWLLTPGTPSRDRRRSTRTRSVACSISSMSSPGWLRRPYEHIRRPGRSTMFAFSIAPTLARLLPSWTAPRGSHERQEGAPLLCVRVRVSRGCGRR